MDTGLNATVAELPCWLRTGNIEATQLSSTRPCQHLVHFSVRLFVAILFPMKLQLALLLAWVSNLCPCPHVSVDPDREGGQGLSPTRPSLAAPKPGPGPVTAFNAGEWIPVEYYRNNHVGGFIRWSIVARGSPETKENFDKNVFFYTCRESGSNCKPRNGHPYSLYGAVFDGVPNFVIKCGDKIRLPHYLDDGEYVLQFTNFATGHNFNDPNVRFQRIARVPT